MNEVALSGHVTSLIFAILSRKRQERQQEPHADDPNDLRQR